MLFSTKKGEMEFSYTFLIKLVLVTIAGIVLFIMIKNIANAFAPN